MNCRAAATWGSLAWAVVVESRATTWVGSIKMDCEHNLLAMHEFVQQRRRLPAGALKIQRDTGQWWVAQAAQKWVIIHSDHRYVFRNSQSGLTAGRNDFASPQVRWGDDTTRERQSAKPPGQAPAFANPVLLGYRRTRIKLARNSMFGQQPGGGMFPEPRPLRTARLAHKGKMAEAEFQQMFGGEPDN